MGHLKSRVIIQLQLSNSRTTFARTIKEHQRSHISDNCNSANSDHLLEFGNDLNWNSEILHSENKSVRENLTLKVPELIFISRFIIMRSK